MVAASLLGLAGASSARAANVYWDSDASNTPANSLVDGSNLGGFGTWDASTASWFDGTNEVAWNNANSDTAVFWNTPLYALSAGWDTVKTVTLNTPITVGGLVFSAPNYLVTGSTLTLAGTTPSVSTKLGETSEIASIVAGAAGLNKTGFGTLRLSNASNTYTGVTTITNGVLAITSAGALGLATSDITIANTNVRGSTAGEFFLQGSLTGSGMTISRNISLAGTGPLTINANGIGLLSYGTNTISGNLSTNVGTVNSGVASIGGVLTLSGTVSVAGTISSAFWNIGTTNGTGVGTVQLTGTLTGTGSITKVGGGTLILSESAASGFTGTVRVPPNNSIRVTNASAMGGGTNTGGNAPIDLYGGIFEFRIGASNAAAVAIGSNAYARASSTLMLDHAIGAYALNTQNNFGTLYWNSAGAAYSLTVNGRDGAAANITAFTASAQTTTTYTATFNNSGSGLLAFSGDVWSETSTSAQTLAINASASDVIIAGNLLANGTVAHVLTKSGVGVLTISGVASTIAGAINVSGAAPSSTAPFSGALAITDFRSLGTTSTAAINLGNATTTPGFLVIGTGTTPTAAGLTTSRVINLNTTTAAVYLNASQPGANPVIISSNFTVVTGSKNFFLGGTNTAENIITGVIPDSTTLALVKNDAGLWALSGLNTYAGTTTITAGTLRLKATAAASNIISSLGAVSFGLNSNTYTAGGTLELVAVSNLATTESLGALTPTAGLATIKLTGNGTGSANLTFTSLGAVSAPTGVNIDTSAAVGGVVTLTGVATTTATTAVGNGHIYFNGADFAVSTSGALSAMAYGAAGFTNAGAGAATMVTSTHNFISGPVTAQTSVTATTLKLTTSDLTLNTGATLTVNAAAATNDGGILQTGGSATISGGTGITTGGSGALIFRVNGASDQLTLGTPILSSSTGGWTKNGLGTLVFNATMVGSASATNTINEGKVKLSTGAVLGPGTYGSASGTPALIVRQGGTLDLNGTTQPAGAFDGAGVVTNSSTNNQANLSVSAGTVFSGVFQEEVGAQKLNVTALGANTVWSGLSTFTGVMTYGSTNGVSASPVRYSVVTLANIGSASSIGKGDASSDASNAASLVFTGNQYGGFRYVGLNSVSIDRLFTLNSAVANPGGMFENQAANNAALIFNKTTAISFGAAANGYTAAQVLTLGGASTADNLFNPQLTNNAAASGAAQYTGLLKQGAGTWILGNSANSYSGATTITGGTLVVSVGAPGAASWTLPSTSPLVVNAGVVQATGNLTGAASATPTAGTGTVTLQATASGFASDTGKLVVALGGLGSPSALTWGSGGFFSTATTSLVLNSATSLGEVEIKNAINLAATTHTITVTDNPNTYTDYATISGVLSNGSTATALTLSLGAPLQLFGQNTYTGITNVTTGTLIVNSLGLSTGSAVGTSVGNSSGANLAANALTLGGGSTTGAVLQYVGPGETSDRMIRYNVTTTGNVQLQADGAGPLILTNFLNDMAAGAKILYLRGSNVQGNMITSNLADNGGTLGVYVDGGATWILTGNNSFTGLVNVTGGALGLGSNTALGGATATWRNNNGVMFTYGGDRTLASAFSSGITTTSYAGVFTGDFSLAIVGSLVMPNTTASYTFTNTIAPGKNLTIGNGAYNFVYGAQTSKSTLTFNGSGDTILNAQVTTTNTFGVNVTYSGTGSLTVNNLLSALGNATVANVGTFTISGGTVKSGLAEFIPDAINNPSTFGGGVTMNPASGTTATWNLNGFSETINALTATTAGSTTIIDNASATPVSFTIGANDATVGFGAATGTFSLRNSGGGALTLIKIGAGVATFTTNANSYTGPTLIKGGTLSVTSFNSVSGGAATSSLGAPTTVANGTITLGDLATAATLKYAGTGEVTDRVINLAGTTGAVSLDASGTGNLRFTSNLFVAGVGSKTLTLQGTGAGDFAGIIPNYDGSNVTTVTKAGTGMWSILGANTFTGVLTNSAGALNITGSYYSANLGSIVNSAFLGVVGPVSIGSSAVTVASGASLRLLNTDAVNNNALTGTITVNGGTLLGYNAAAGSTGTNSLGTATVVLTGTNPTLRLAPALGTSLTGGTTQGIFIKGYNVGVTSLATTNFLGASNTITAATNGGALLNYAYLNVPAGGAVLTGQNIPQGTASTNFPATTSYQITALLNITTAGNYTFSTKTDDFGSLVIDGNAPIVSAVTTVTGATYLTAGLHTFSYRAGNNATNGTIGVQYQGPDAAVMVDIPASVLLQATNKADLANTLSTPLQLAATTVATIDIASSTTLTGGLAMTGTGAGTTLKVTGSGDLTRLTINGLTLTDSLTIGDATVNPTAFISLAGTFTNSTSAPTTLTLSNQLADGLALNALGNSLTDGSGGGVLSLVKLGTSGWMLSGTNSYTGTTTISAGFLEFATKASLYNGNSASWTNTNISVTGTLGLGVGGVGQFTAADVATLYAALSGATGGFASGSSLALDTAGAAGTVTLATNFANPNAGANTFGLQKIGVGTLELSGASTYTGNTTVVSGVLNITGSLTGNATSSLLTSGNLTDTSVINVSGNVTASSLYMGTALGAVSVYNQTAGTVTMGLVTDTNTNNAVSGAGYGYFNLTGGTFVQAGTRFNINSANGGIGVVYVGGAGTLNLTGSTYVLIGYNGTNAAGALTIGPGGTVIRDGASQSLGINWTATGSFAAVNLAGGLLSGTTGVTRFGGAGAATNQTGFFNLAGGIWSVGTGGLTMTNTSGSGNNYYVNLLGATVRSTGVVASLIPASNAYGTVVATSFGAVANSAIGGANFTGGLSFDTGGFNSTVPGSLQPATGSGVAQSSLAVTGGTGYVGAPLVQFTGGTLVAGGTPASGYALISGGAVTGIVITSPGTYSVAPTVTLTGGGGTGAGVTVGTLVANSEGALTKLGLGTLTFSGVNTLTSAITVSGGNLALGAGGLSNASLFGLTKGRSVLVASGAALVGNTAASFADLARFVEGASTGGVVPTSASTNLDLSAAGLGLPTMALFAGSSDLTYTGTYTPGTPGTYRLGASGTSTLTYGAAITGNASVTVGAGGTSGGYVVLGGTSNFTGGVTLAGSGLKLTSASTAANFGAGSALVVAGNSVLQWAAGATFDLSVLPTQTYYKPDGTTAGSTGAANAGINFSAGTLTIDTNGNNVTLAGPIGYGAGGFNKNTGAGTLIINGAPSSGQPFTGAATITTGAIQLGHANALRNATVTVSATNGLTFSPSIGTFTLGSLAGASNFVLADTGSGAITLQVGQSWASSPTYSAVMSGAGGLTKIGVGTQTISGIQTYTGATTITGGTANNVLNSTGSAVTTSALVFNFTAAATNILAPTSPIVFGSSSVANLNPGGGTLKFSGSALTAANTQTLGGVTVAGGVSSLTTAYFASATANTIAVTLGPVTRTAVTVTGSGYAASATGGGTIDFGNNGGTGNTTTYTTTSVNDANGLLGGWATVGGVDFAAVSGGVIGAYAGYTTYTTGTSLVSNSASNIRINGASSMTLTAANGATTDLNTLTAAATSLGGAPIVIGDGTAASTGILRLGNVTGVGVFLMANGVPYGWSVGNGVANAGSVTAGNATTSELILNNAQTSVTGVAMGFYPKIVDNGLGKPLTLIKTGPGQINMYATNTFSGGFIIQNGRVNVNAVPAALGVGAVTILPGGQVLVTGGTLPNNFFIAGTGINETPNYGVLRLDGTGTTVTGNVTLIGDASIGTNGTIGTVAGGISGNISGSYSLARAGTTSTLARMILSGTNTYTGQTLVSAGVLQLGAGVNNNAYAGLAARSVVTSTYGTVYVNTGTAADFQTFLNTKASPASTGSFAIDTLNAAATIDYAQAGLTGAYLSAATTVNFTGTYVPGTSGQYRLGGGDGVLNFNSLIADTATGRSSVLAGVANNGGSVGLASLGFDNTFTGGISFNGGTLQADTLARLGNPGPGVVGVTVTSSGGIFRWSTGATFDLSAVSGGVALVGSTWQLDTNANGTSGAPINFANGLGNYGAGLLQKNGSGFLQLSGVHTSTGNVLVQGGTLLLNNANPFNAGYGTSGLATAATVSANNVSGAILQLAVDTTVGAVVSTNSTTTSTSAGAISLAGHTLTLAGITSTTVTGYIYGGAGIAGSGGLTKIGGATLTLASNNTGNYTGATTILGGTLALDYSILTTAPTAIINIASPLVLGGGTLNMKGKGTGVTSSQTFGGLTLNPGASLFTATLNSSTALNLSVGAITRPVAGATVDFAVSSAALGATGTVSTTTGNNGSTGILGGYATVNSGADFAAAAGAGPTYTLAAYAAYTSAYTAGTNVVNGSMTSIGGSALSINSLRFNSPSAITLDATGGLTLSSGGLLLTPTVAANATTITGGTLSSGNGTDLIVHQYSTGTLTLASKITGSIGLTKAGPGVLAVSNSGNDFTGPTNIGGSGVVQVLTSGALSTGDINLNSAAQVLLVPGVSLGNPVNLRNAWGVANQAALYINGSTGSATVSGTVTVYNSPVGGGLFGTGGATLYVTGPVNAAAGQIVSVRLGNVVLSGGGTYDYFFASGGTTSLGAANGLSTGAIIDVAGAATGAILDLAGYNQTAAGLMKNNANTATVTNTSLTLSTLTLNVAASDGGIHTGDFTYAGALTGNLAVVKSGAGMQTLSGANTFTGGTTVAAGTLRLGSATALGGDSGYNGGLVVNGGTLDLNGYTNVSVGAFSGSGGIITDNSGQAGLTIFSAAPSTDGAFAGAINNGTFRTLGFFKDGAGVLTLSGTSNYAGATRIFAGALNVRSAGALGTSAGGTTVYAGAALQLQAGVTTAEPMTLSGLGVGGLNGALRNISGDNVASGALTLSAATRINADAGSLTLSGGLAGTDFALTFGGAGSSNLTAAFTLGAGALTIDGLGGTVSLQAAGTYTGATTVAAGTLNLRHSSALGSSSGVTVAAGAALQLQGGVTLAGVPATTSLLQSVAGNNTWAALLTAQTGGPLVLKADADTLTVSGGVNAQSADTVNRALQLAGAGNGVLAGVAVTNPASVTKTGAGVWSYAVAQTYTAPTAINAGTLQAGAANVFPTNSAFTLANTAGATLDLNGYNQSLKSLDGAGAAGGAVTLGSSGVLSTGANTSYNGSITGSGSSGLTKTGNGVMTLGPAAAVTGPVAVAINQGTLLVHGTTDASVTVTVAANAVLGGKGTLGGTTTLAAGSTLQAGDGASGNLTTRALVFGALTGDTARIQLYNLDATASIINAGAITTNGGAGSVTFYATNGGALSNGTYDLLTYLSVDNFNAFRTAAGSISGLSGRQTANLINDTVNSKITLQVLGDSPVWTGFDGAGSAQDLVWHLPAGAAQNFQLISTGTPTNYQAGDSVLFNDLAGTGNTTVHINEGNVAPTSVTISNSLYDYVFDSAGSYGITGSTGIVKAGTRSATFNNSNSFTGGVTVNAGTLIFNATNSIDGGLTVNGGTLALNAATTLTGDARIGNGTLALGAAGALGSANAVIFGAGATGSLQLNGNATTLAGLTTNAVIGTPSVSNGAATAAVLTVNLAAGTNTFAGVLQDGAGGGTLGLTKSGAGTWVLTGANTHTGGNTVAAGTLQVGQGGVLSGDTVISSGASLVFNSPADLTNAGALSGAGTLTTSGTGKLILTGTAGHGGGTTISAGATLQIGNGGSTGALSGTGVLADAGDLRVNVSGTTTLPAVISGTGNLTVDAGTLVLTATNLYQGATTIASGASLQIGNGGATGTPGTAAGITDNGTLILSRSGAFNFSKNITGTGGLTVAMATGGVLTLSGSNSYAGTTTVASGTLTVANAAAWSGSSALVLGSAGNSTTLDLNGTSKSFSSLTTAGTAANQILTNSVTGTSTITFNSAGSSTFNGVLADGSATKKIALTLTGGGALTLGYANTFTGGAIIASGTGVLGANNAFGTGALTLGGSGTAGTLDLAGYNQSISSFLLGAGATAASQIFGNSSTTTDATLTYTGTAQTFAAVIQDTLGAGSRKVNLALSGSGIFTVTGANTYSGTTTIGASATLQVGAGSTAGQLGTGNVTVAGTLLLNRSDALVIPSISGSGAVTLATAGTVSLASGAAISTTGALNFGSANASGTSSNLDLSAGSATVASALIRTNNATANNVTIGSGKSWTLTNGLTMGYDAGSGTGATLSNLTVAGAGAMSVTAGTINISVNQAATNAAYYSSALLDVSGLASFTASVTTLNVGVGSTTTGQGVLLLSNTANTIAATTMQIGHSGGNNGNGASYVTLGTSTNVLNVDTLNIGLSKLGGTLQFASQTAGSNGTVTIANKAGTGAANITVGSNNGTSTSAVIAATIDLRGHNSTVAAGTLQLGIGTGNTNTGGASGVLNFDTGTMTVTAVTLGSKSGTAGTGAANGTINLSGGSLTVNSSGSVALAVQAAATGSASGTLAISGGTFTVRAGDTFSLANSSIAGGVATGVLSLTGGVATINTNLLRAVGAGTENTTLTINGGTLDMAGFNIGSLTATIGSGSGSLSLLNGTLRNVGQINGGAGFAVGGTNNTFTLAGTNTFTGVLTVTAGSNSTLVAASDTQLGLVSGITINQNAGLQTTASFATTKPISLAGANAHFAPDAGTTLTLNGAVTSSYNGLTSVRNIGAGTIIFNSAANSFYTNTVFLMGAGTLNLGHAAALTGAALKYNGGAGLDNTSGSAMTLTGAKGLELTSGFTFTGTSSLTIGGDTSFVQTAASTRTLNIVANSLDIGGILTTGADVTTTARVDGSLNKTGAGTLILSGNSDYTGTTTVVAGTLQVGIGATAGSLGSGAVTDNATLVFNRSDATTVANDIAGSGNLTQSGTGTLTLSGNNSYGGVTTITNGTLKLGSATALGASTVTVTGGTLDLNSQTVTAAVTLNSGTLTGGTFDVANLTATAGTISAKLTGTGGVTKSAAGTLTLSGPNDYSGATTVSAGTLSATAGALSATSGLTVNGAALTAVDVKSGATLSLNASGTAAFSGASLALGAVSNANAASDALLFSSNSGTVTLASLAGGGKTRFAASATITGGVAEGTVTVAGLLTANVTGGTVVADSITGTVSGGAAVTITGVLSSLAAGTVTLGDAAVAVTTLSTGNVVLGSGALTVSNGTQTGVISGSTGTVIKDGSGELVLQGANTYGGATSVTAGKLTVTSLGDGSAASSLGTAALTPGNLVLGAGTTLGYAGAGETSARGFTVGSSVTLDASGTGALAFSASAQIAFANSTSSRTLTLDGANTAANTLGAAAAGSPLDADKFNQVIKNGVGTWIIAHSGTIKSTAEIDVNSGVLGLVGGVAPASGLIVMANGSTLRWETGNSDDLSGRLHFGSGANATLNTGSNDVTFANSLTFDGGTAAAVTKTGTGTVTLAASNSGVTGGFTLSAGGLNVTHATGLGSGATVVNGGTLSVNAVTTNAVTVNNAGTVGGNGTVAALTVSSGGHVGPGNSPGTLNVTGTTTLAGGSIFEWQVQDALDPLKYDHLNAGTLDLTGASSASRITFKIIALDGVIGGSTLGLPANFSSSTIRTFNLGTVGTLNFGSSTNINDYFTFDVGQFNYTEGTASNAGLWSLNYDSGSGALTLTAVPEPSTYGLGIGALALAVAAVRRRRKIQAKA